jgi:hypothetical protein
MRRCSLHNYYWWMRPVHVLIDPKRYDRLEKVADEQNVPIAELLARRGVDLLLNELETDLPRAAAALVAAIDFGDLGKLTAIIHALHAVKAALPPRSP